MASSAATAGAARPPSGSRPGPRGRSSTRSASASASSALERAADLGLKIQDHPGKRTFIATEAGYRLEIHPPRDWIDELLANTDELRLGELHLRAQDPEEKAVALSEILGVDRLDRDVLVGNTLVRFQEGGPEGRPELVAEVLL